MPRSPQFAHKPLRLGRIAPADANRIAALGKTPRDRRPNGIACAHKYRYAAALRQLGLKHLRIRPGRPRTNGKAERLIQTLLNEWAYARIYGSSAERTAALALYLERYNYRRPHGSLAHQPPATRLNNLVRNYN